MSEERDPLYVKAARYDKLQVWMEGNKTFIRSSGDLCSDPFTRRLYGPTFEAAVDALPEPPTIRCIGGKDDCCNAVGQWGEHYSTDQGNDCKCPLHSNTKKPPASDPERDV